MKTPILFLIFNRPATKTLNFKHSKTQRFLYKNYINSTIILIKELSKKSTNRIKTI